MTETEQKINRFLVEVFNDVLRLEEADISRGPFKNLSVSEMHVLETVQKASQESSMSELAARLRVTASTLTVAVKTLENKGYLVRRRSERDKRKVIVALTPGGEAALVRHAAFHARLIKQVTGRLTPAQTEQLGDTLSTLHGFFAPDAQNGAEAPRKGDDRFDPDFD